jgi:hypothetical protein
MILALLLAAAPPDPAPGFDPPPDHQPAFARPAREASLDPVVAAQVVARLVALHLLDTPADADDPVKARAAIAGFQSGLGLRPTGVLDRRTLAFFGL